MFRGVPYARPLVVLASDSPRPAAGALDRAGREATVFGPAAVQSAIDVTYAPGFSLWEGIGATSEETARP